jgi:hypothetical protein
MRFRTALAACVLSIGAVLPTADGGPTVQQRACDMLWLAGGERLFGILMGPPQGGKVGIVVDREWFRKHYREMYDTTVAGENDRRRALLESLAKRLAAWRERRSEPKLLAAFIERSLEQTDKRLRGLDDEKSPLEPSQLVLVEVPQAKVRKHYAQPPATRRVLALAWQERVPGAVEQTSAALIEQLKAKEIDPQRVAPDLADRLGPLTQDDRQWAAKVALVEYEILGKPHYQGTGSKLIRDDSGQPRPDLAKLFAATAEEQLGDLLGELLGSAGGAKRKGNDKMRQAVEGATREAAAEGHNGVRITYLSQDLAGHKVTVTASFLARMPDGAWQSIWEHTSSIDTTKPRTDEETKLTDDPQIAEVLKIAEGLGIDPNDERIRIALRHGVVTNEALVESNAAFVEFMLPNVRSLEGPPIAVPEVSKRPAAN